MVQKALSFTFTFLALHVTQPARDLVWLFSRGLLTINVILVEAEGADEDGEEDVDEPFSLVASGMSGEVALRLS